MAPGQAVLVTSGPLQGREGLIIGYTTVTEFLVEFQGHQHPVRIARNCLKLMVQVLDSDPSQLNR